MNVWLRMRIPEISDLIGKSYFGQAHQMCVKKVHA